MIYLSSICDQSQLCIFLICTCGATVIFAFYSSRHNYIFMHEKAESYELDTVPRTKVIFIALSFFSFKPWSKNSISNQDILFNFSVSKLTNVIFTPIKPILSYKLLCKKLIKDLIPIFNKAL